jgi:sec-independent protein translocase protein TatB
MGIPPTIEFASLGMADSLIIMVIALVFFGPRKLPQIGRQIGKLMYEFRKASNDFKFQMEEELRNAEDADRRKQEEARLRALALAAPPPAPTAIEMPGTAESSAASPDPVAVQSPVDSAEFKAEETVPQIQPPSTGEPVPAARPWCPPTQAASAEPEIAADSNVSTGVAPAQPNPAQDDPAAAAAEETHHG